MDRWSKEKRDKQQGQMNPLRAGIVETLAKLDRYKWCGHCVIMNRCENEWQDRRYVLKWFGRKEGNAKKIL